MKVKLLFAGLLVAMNAAAARVPSLHDITAALEGVGCFRASVECVITPPDAPEDVVYNVDITQLAAPGDTLAPCSYLVRWTLTEPERLRGSGFSAYFDGNHYRYRPGKLQEYHFVDAPEPFAPAGNRARGVQMQAQFIDMLPAVAARNLDAAAANPDCSTVVTAADGRVVVKMTEARDGYEIKASTLVLDAATLMPVAAETVYNSGQPSEQTVSARFAEVGTVGCEPLSEAALIDMFPVEFEKYRRDSFSLQSLPGGPFPTVAAPTVGGARWIHHSGEPFGRPTVVAVLDSDVDSTDAVVGELRSALDALPFSADLVLAFVGNDRDAVAELAGATRAGETVLAGATSLARDCGVAVYPSIIFCRADGQVSDVHIGRNNDLRSIVIQKSTMAK